MTPQPWPIAPVSLPPGGPLFRIAQPPAELGSLPDLPEAAVLTLMGLASVCGLVKAAHEAAQEDLLVVAGVLLACPHAGPLHALCRLASWRLLLAGARLNPDGPARPIVADRFPGKLAELDRLMTTCREHWEHGPCEP